MNVLILNGSPRINGNTSIAIREMEKVFKESDVDCSNWEQGYSRLYCLQVMFKNRQMRIQ